MRLDGTVLLTGAAAGIGRAAALHLAQAGWHCVLVDADAEGLKRLRDDWPKLCPSPLCLAADLTDPAQIAALARQVPPLDALINNAGLSAGGCDALSDEGDGVAGRLLALNLRRLPHSCRPVPTSCARAHASSTSPRGPACVRFPGAGSTAPARPG